IEKGAAGLAVANANGTGAFSVIEHKPSVSTRFKPNPDWWRTPQHSFDGVVFCVMAGDGLRVDALLSAGKNHVDWIEPVPPNDWQRVNTAKTVGRSYDSVRTIFLGFGMASDPFKDPKIRKAIYHAIDTQSLASVVMRNFTKIADSLVAPGLFAPISQIT